MLFKLILAGILFLSLLLVGACYLVWAFSHFGWIQLLAKGQKFPSLGISFLILLITAVFFVCSLSFVDAIVIFFHTVVFFLLSGVLLFVFKIFSKHEPAFYLQGWIAITVTLLTLSIAYFHCTHVWQKDYHLETDKSLAPLRVAMLSDIHLGTTFNSQGFTHYLQRIESQHPDILLIPGDFVDYTAQREDLRLAAKALSELSIPYGVWFSFGNHDEPSLGVRNFSGDEFRQILTEQHIHILEDSCELIDNRFYIAGRKDRSMGPRASIQDLLAPLDTSKYIIVLDHQPNDYANEAESSADLILSGHTHGGQLFPIHWIGRWIGAFDRAYGYERRNATDFIVTSGISDWAMHFKTGARSEYVIIDITSSENVPSA